MAREADKLTEKENRTQPTIRERVQMYSGTGLPQDATCYLEA